MESSRSRREENPTSLTNFEDLHTELYAEIKRALTILRRKQKKELADSFVKPPKNKSKFIRRQKRGFCPYLKSLADSEHRTMETQEQKLQEFESKHDSGVQLFNAPYEKDEVDERDLSFQESLFITNLILSAPASDRKNGSAQQDLDKSVILPFVGQKANNLKIYNFSLEHSTAVSS